MYVMLECAKEVFLSHRWSFAGWAPLFTAPYGSLPSLHPCTNIVDAPEESLVLQRNARRHPPRALRWLYLFSRPALTAALGAANGTRPQLNTNQAQHSGVPLASDFEAPAQVCFRVGDGAARCG